MKELSVMVTDKEYEILQAVMMKIKQDGKAASFTDYVMDHAWADYKRLMPDAWDSHMKRILVGVDHE